MAVLSVKEERGSTSVMTILAHLGNKKTRPPALLVSKLTHSLRHIFDDLLVAEGLHIGSRDHAT